MRYVYSLLIALVVCACSDASMVTLTDGKSYDAIWLVNRGAVVQKLPATAEAVKRTFGCNPQPDVRPLPPPPFESAPPVEEKKFVFSVPFNVVVMGIAGIVLGLIVGVWVANNSD